MIINYLTFFIELHFLVIVTAREVLIAVTKATAKSQIYLFDLLVIKL